MGIAVLSGVVASLESHPSFLNGPPKWESHTSGTSTPVGPPDATSPSRFIACVSRDDSVRYLKKTFHEIGGLAETVEVRAKENVKSVEEAEVVLLW